MDVSVDTNVLIHLYDAFLKDLLLLSFEKVYVYEYIIDEELLRNAPAIYAEVSRDILDGRINKVGSADLASKGIKELFEEHYRDYRILFAGDRGEAYAVALASVLGIEAFVSDDTKDGGPHETLVKELIEDVVPFTFYELLFLQFLKAEITADQFNESFDQISGRMSKPMDFASRINRVLRRFHKNRSTDRDYQWLQEYCYEHNIDLRNRINVLIEYVKKL